MVALVELEIEEHQKDPTVGDATRRDASSSRPRWRREPPPRRMNRVRDRAALRARPVAPFDDAPFDTSPPGRPDFAVGVSACFETRFRCRRGPIDRPVKCSSRRMQCAGRRAPGDSPRRADDRVDRGAVSGLTVRSARISVLRVHHRQPGVSHPVHQRHHVLERVGLFPRPERSRRVDAARRGGHVQGTPARVPAVCHGALHPSVSRDLRRVAEDEAGACNGNHRGGALRDVADSVLRPEVLWRLQVCRLGIRDVRRSASVERGRSWRGWEEREGRDRGSG